MGVCMYECECVCTYVCARAIQLHQEWDLRRFFSLFISTLSDS